MQAILKSTDRPLVETVRATLQSEGIEVVVEGDAVTALPFIPMTVLVSDEDVALAQDLVKDLVSSAANAGSGGHNRWGRLFLVAILIAFLIFCGNLLIG